MTGSRKATRILARSFFSRLRKAGYSSNEVLDIATELIERVTVERKGLKPEPTASDLKRPRRA